MEKTVGHSDAHFAAEWTPETPRSPISESVSDKIRDGVRQGRFVPGQRLHERQLVDEFGVSRGSVREALRLLVADGVIEIVPHRGAMVRQFSRQEVVALHEIREVLEGLAASLAASNIGSRNRGRTALERSVATVEAAIAANDPDTYIEANAQMHAAIAALSDNPCLPAMIDRCHISSLRLQTGRFLSKNMMELRHQEHQSVIDAILKGKPEEAEAAMRTHVRGSRALVLKLPDFVFKPS